ncbi:MAG: hypothetical protein IJT94_16550, partial [Oscillibacter sp.]|nr:hypothetical protein [Oscillibacter sp.]
MALAFRSLDDQSYESILEQAKSRLPWLCPAWTDHNSHDPGITILELMAWYKELQQYYMNQITPAVQRSLLKLAGVVPEGPRAAVCMVEAEPDGPARLAGSRLKSPQGIPFELPEPIPSLRTRLASLRIAQGGREYDVEALVSGEAVFYPFCFRGGGNGGGSGTGRPAPENASSVLRLGFSGKPVGELRLWFDVSEPEGSRRNPPDAESLPPRTIVWEAENCGEETLCPVEVLRDDTWYLSWSGYVTLSAPAEWKAGAEGLYWLSVRQSAAGCEEEVRLSDISANRFRCVQRESRVQRYSFQMPSGFGREVLIPDAQARFANLAVFRRTQSGWEQAERVQDAALAEGRLVRLDMDAGAQDGEDNLMVVSQDTLTPLLFDLKGLPGERLFL